MRAPVSAKEVGFFVMWREGKKRRRGAYDGSVVVHFVEEVAEAGVFFRGHARVGGCGDGVRVGG